MDALSSDMEIVEARRARKDQKALPDTPRSMLEHCREIIAKAEEIIKLEDEYTPPDLILIGSLLHIQEHARNAMARIRSTPKD